jgi:hypothetical protein
MSKPRRTELHRRQRRKRSLKKLRSRFSAATSESEKKKIFAKVSQISPTLSRENFSS